MKIVIDARFYGLENAGLGRYTTHLLHSLQKIDNDNKYTILLRKKYFDTLSFPPKWKKVLADYMHYSLAEQLHLPQIIKSENPDLVHFLHFNVPILYSGPYIVTIHDLLMHNQKGKEATTLPLPAYLIKRFAYMYVFKKSVSRATHIIVPSGFVKKDVASYYKLPDTKLSVVYEGVDQKIFTQKARRNAVAKFGLNGFYFIYTGNAYPHKNLKRCIEAVLLLNKSSKEHIILAIVSSRNVFVTRLEKLIKQMNATRFVKLLGFVSDTELSQLYRNSVGFIYPSLMEGFGLPGLEAMAAGTIVLVSDIPVFKEVYKNNVVYFNPYNFASMAEAMNEVINIDEQMRVKVIKKGQQFVRRYSWERMSEETLKVYQNTYKHIYNRNP